METKHHIIRNKEIEIFDINIDLLNKIDYNEIEKLNENDLRWLLYIFVCEDKKLRKEVYGESEMMKKVNDKIDNYQTFLNQWLYYDKDAIDNAGFYQKGIDDNKKDTAKKMLEDNLDNDLIIKYTGLTQDEIEIIIKEENETE